MNAVWSRMLETIDAQGAAALVSVVATAGSAPREVGARMVVRPDGGFWGTVGGGALEWELAHRATALLNGHDPGATEGRGELREWPLGPDLGQCCGGRVTTIVEVHGRAARDQVAAWAASETAGFESEVRVAASGHLRRTVLSAAAGHAPVSRGAFRERFADDRTPLWLFGAGHVGRALVMALAPLPFSVRWIDPRPDAFPTHAPANVTAALEADPAAALAKAPPGALLLVMTHSHALDLAIVEAALGRAEIGFVGLIGSATKRARFLSRLRAAGLPEARLGALVCPIGVPGLEGKEPAVIAASVAVQLLQERQRQSEGRRRPARADLRLAGGRP
ncbi:MAG: xanthine dehydrogenase accessory protein XdhC [Alsobacter sp.]